MNRLTASLVAVIAGFFCLSDAAAAQRLHTPPFSQPIGFQIRSTSHVDHDIAGRTTVATIDGGSRPARYFLTGALIGAAIAGVAVGIELSKCDDCMVVTPVFLMAAGAGATGGGLLGLLVYAWRKEQFTEPGTK